MNLCPGYGKNLTGNLYHCAHSPMSRGLRGLAKIYKEVSMPIFIALLGIIGTEMLVEYKTYHEPLIYCFNS